MNNIWVNSFSVFLSFSLYIYFFKNLYNTVFSNKVTYGIIFGFIFIKLSIGLLNPFINLVTSFIIYLVLTKILFEKKSKNMIMYVLMYCCISIISEDISFLLFKMVVPDELAEFKNMISFVIFGNIIARVLQFLILRTILNIIKSKNDNYFTKKDVISFSILPISSILIILSLHIWVDTSNSKNPVLFFAVIGLLLSNLNLSNLYHKMMEKEKLQFELKILKTKIYEKNLFFEQVKSRDLEVRKICHDIKKNYHLLYSDVLDKNYIGVKKNLEKLLNDTEIVKNKISGVNLIDNMLSYKKSILDEYNIDLTCIGSIVNLSGIEEIDFNIIFENVIDNAIESCSKTNNRRIHIILNYNKTVNIIKVVNSCDSVKIQKGRYMSMKDDSNKHGYGMDIIKQEIEKNNGKAIFKFNAKMKIFETTLFIPLENL